MKRIYMAMALMGGFSLAASAQLADIQAVIIMDTANDVYLTPGKHLTPTNPSTSADSTFGIWRMWNNGPGYLVATDKISFLTSQISRYLTQEEFTAEQEKEPPGIPLDKRFGEDKYFWVNQITLENNVEPQAAIFSYSYDPISDIKMLADWDRWAQYGCDSGFRFYGPPHDVFQNGKEYAYFMYIYGLGEDATTERPNDGDRCNNLAAHRVIWDGDGTGIKKAVFAPKEKVSLNVYPNPATDNLKFSYNYQKGVDVTVVVRDAVGRVVMTQDYGKMIGSQDFIVNVSSLNPGLYTIEMGTSYESAISKFSKL
jgi:hypothetical protein